MITISLYMIVKNVESVIGQCLARVTDLVSEFVIVDAGSTAARVPVVNRFISQTYTFKCSDDFAAERNYTFKQATMDDIPWLDVEGVIGPVDRIKLRELKPMLDSNVDSVTVLYHLSQDEYGNVMFSLKRNRLIQRSLNFRWMGPIHEYLEVEGRVVHSDPEMLKNREDLQAKFEQMLKEVTGGMSW